MEKLNIAEILKDCPKGMELDCTCADNVVFDKIIEYDQIKCVIGEYRDPFILDKYGRLLHICCPKCVIFPKGKTTWEGFQRPFKDGDVVVCMEDIGEHENEFTQAFILKCIEGKEKGYCYIGYDFRLNKVFEAGKWYFDRLATEEEKQKLFDTIKANGYKWNPETKTLDKLIVPKFKVGDIIQDIDTYKVKITEVNIEDGCYGYESMIINGIGGISFSEQDKWELVPNKFDITTLKPFDKVLVRDTNGQVWTANLFSHVLGSIPRLPITFVCVSRCPNQCIPYEGNEYLIGTTNNCDDYYKTWE